MAKKILCLLLGVTLLFTNVVLVSATEQATPQIKNVIYMIPDGGAMASFFLADYVKQAGGLSNKYPNVAPVETGEMFLKDYLVGAETTYSANNAVTDSAASGTALSSGYKTNNGMIGITPAKKPRANILEACQELGKNTGIVVTYEWTNATPAAFSAHAENRGETLVLGEQIVNQDIDVVFGNTHNDYKSQEWFTDEAFISRGYEVITTKDQLNAIEPGDRVWGKLPAAYYDYKREATTPNLAELTSAAIKALDDGNENGFFLMVEGSAVDGGGHGSNALQMVSEWLAFDAACKIAIEYAKERTDTMVVVLPDHDTGGLKYGDTYTASSLQPLVSEVQKGNNPSGITWEGNGNHTNRNGGIFMYLPEGVAYPEGIDPTKKDEVLADFEADFRTCSVNRIDNTGIAKYLETLLGVSLDAVTEKLFVDVTDNGTYDADTEIFTFTTEEDTTSISVERNTSWATVDGKLTGLDGEVAVYVGNKFYVPQTLLTGISKSDKEIEIFADYNTKQVIVKGTTQKPADDVTVIVTEPGKSIQESLDTNTLTSINQTKSTPWGEYSLRFDVGTGKIGDYNYFTRIAGEGGMKEYTFSFKNMAVEKNGIPVEDISQLAEGDTIRLVLNGYDASYDGNAMIAQYDEYGALIHATAVPIKGSAVNYEDESYIDATVQKGAKTIKAYYWNTLTHAPFTGVYVID